MKSFTITIIAMFFFGLAPFCQERPLFTLYGTKLVNDSEFMASTFSPVGNRTASIFSTVTRPKEARKLLLHTSRKGRPVEGYFFPGLSNKKALVIGGMHGTELSSIEVAMKLISKLSSGEKPFYNVVVIPSLFPDNAQEAEKEGADRMQTNSGRYTTLQTPDPNRQMPPLGRPFLHDSPVDALEREIEGENVALLQLIQNYAPDRVISIHAIKDRSKAGVFADPRTDCSGFALGYETDKALALLMARHIQAFGGACPGNRLNGEATALYYLDPPVAEEGHPQTRSFDGAKSTGRSVGVSLGSWCSTAVCDPGEVYSRPAIRTFTMEFPGYQKPSEYKKEDDRRRYEQMVEVYAASIRHYFLHSFFEEGDATESKLLASN